MTRIGLFGGTFNPVHNGHMHLAETAVSQLKLEKLIFIPSNIPPHKQADNLCRNDIRYEMCRLALSEYDNYILSDYEINREGRSYSIYTVEYFRKLYPEAEIFLMVGSDMFLCFDKWYRFKDILSQVNLAVVSRETDDEKLLERKALELSRYGRTTILKSPPYLVSSTEIRDKIKNGEKYHCYLPKKVVQYIRLNNLYR